MTFTTENWHRFNPPNFTTALPGAEIEPYPCSLHLRNYDILRLTDLLKGRGLPGKTPEQHKRKYGPGSRLRWWADGTAVIPRSLFVLCAITQELKPPDASLPAPCLHCQDTGLIWYNDASGRSRSVACPNEDCEVSNFKALGLPPPDFKEGFPFRPRDGLRGEPRAVLKFGEDLTMRQLTVHLPLVIRERLIECGRRYHDQGLTGVADPRGRFYKFNRSAAVRRLLEAVRVADPRVVMDAPLHFRGIELFARPCTLSDVQAHPRHFVEAEAQMWEAAARREPDPNLSPSRAAQATRDFEARAKWARSRVEAFDAGTVAPDFITAAVAPPGAGVNEQIADLVPVGTKGNRDNKPKRTKIRATSVDKFNPDELG